jgi:hypothetical protein
MAKNWPSIHYSIFLMKFLDSIREEFFLVFANEMLEFFEALSKTGLITIIPQRKYFGNQNIFVI